MEGRQVDTEVVAQALFYALFKLVEINELSGPEAALDWAQMVVDDADYRRAFADEVCRVPPSQ